jgi:4-hydroxy-tetrahydrodipicolinate reductase
MPTRIAVAGATGRLGALVCAVIENSPDATLVARLDSRSDLHEMLGSDLVIDTTLPSISPQVVDFALDQGIKVLVGTSGWSVDKIQALSKKIEAKPGSSVYIVPNFSIGATLQMMLARLVAEHFESVEIVEAHHAGKVDSPSGTATRTAEEIAAVRKNLGGVIAPHSNQTARGEQVAGVPVHSLRLTGVVARQDVIFGGVGETVTLTHDTQSPDAYIAGIGKAISFMEHHTGLAVGLEHALGVSSS